MHSPMRIGPSIYFLSKSSLCHQATHKNFAEIHILKGTSVTQLLNGQCFLHLSTEESLPRESWSWHYHKRQQNHAGRQLRLLTNINLCVFLIPWSDQKKLIILSWMMENGAWKKSHQSTSGLQPGTNETQALLPARNTNSNNLLRSGPPEETQEQIKCPQFNVMGTPPKAGWTTDNQWDFRWIPTIYIYPQNKDLHLCVETTNFNWRVSRFSCWMGSWLQISWGALCRKYSAHKQSSLLVPLVPKIANCQLLQPQ